MAADPDRFARVLVESLREGDPDLIRGWEDRDDDNRALLRRAADAVASMAVNEFHQALLDFHISRLEVTRADLGELAERIRGLRPTRELDQGGDK
jgi:hypothetical protein